MITIKINGEEKQYAAGTTYDEVAAGYADKLNAPAALVMENGRLRELTREVKQGAEVSILTLADNPGHKSYVRTAVFMLVKAIYEVTGRDKEKRVKVEFSIGNGYFIRPLWENADIDEAFLAKVKNFMDEMVKADIKITKTSYSTDEAREIFREAGMRDKDRLFKYRKSSSVNVYDLDGYRDYYYGYMLPSTGRVKYFELEKYEDGFMLLLPETAAHDSVDKFKPRNKLFNALDTASEWGHKLHINTVGDLNERICEDGIENVILVQEALQERRIAEIASDIVSRGGVKFVMIAGPSSSGKTTFSHRLSIQLASFGLTPHPIPVDDYFKNRVDTPKDENGNYNFECLEAIDIELFNHDMLALLGGEEVELPTFNFVTGEREYNKGKKKRLGPDDILVIEGIHGLNDRMSYALPVESKYKVYISALTALNIDGHNRIPTTDNRLIRRLVRDARTRGASAVRTIGMWPSVRKGEEENIFPFQENVDAMFNSASIYELAALKPFAEPLLFSVPADAPEYREAKRLLKFLDYFLSISSEKLPNNSIVREFVGGSCFNV
ncbi:MAG: nucleoside kinase [Lachnospiraceae bacterium]|nr:nucleoside kinase [Lachnospiraceae bacterium]